MTIVTDTGPVHYLVLCGQVELLHQLFGSLLIPSAVHLELLHPHSPRKVRAWASALPKWAATVLPRDTMRFSKLGAGERQALALALQENADFLLIDETLGRRIAVEQGVKVKGTLGVLEEAAIQGLIDLTPTVMALKTTGIFLAPGILDAALERDRLRRQQGN